MTANKGRIYAFDIAEKRLANLKPRMTRAGLTNIHPERIGSEHDPRLGRLKGKADRVLVDAPCSGSAHCAAIPTSNTASRPKPSPNFWNSNTASSMPPPNWSNRKAGWFTPLAACCPKKTKCRSNAFGRTPGIELLDCAELLAALKSI